MQMNGMGNGFISKPEYKHSGGACLCVGAALR